MAQDRGSEEMLPDERFNMSQAHATGHHYFNPGCRMHVDSQVPGPLAATQLEVVPGTEIEIQLIRVC